jgi:hypothetical protein
MKEICGLQFCDNPLGPGSAQVGFENDGEIDHVRVCPKHAWLVMTAPRGTFVITKDRELKRLPVPTIIT